MSQPTTAPRARFRHYLHGDPVEGNPESFYCQKCDAFVVRGHFELCRLGTIIRRGARYTETHEYRYVTARRWWLCNFEVGDPRIIVDDPGNLFRTGTASEQGVPMLAPHAQHGVPARRIGDTGRTCP